MAEKKTEKSNNKWIDNKVQQGKPFVMHVGTSGGVEGCEFSEVLRCVFDFVLPAEYFKFQSFSIQIVYKQKSYLKQASC